MSLPPRAPGPARSAAPFSRPSLALILALACAFSAGCDKGVMFQGPNTPPSLTLTSGPVDTVTSPVHWLVEIAWTASDPDGRVDHFEYAVDPPTLRQASLAQAETSWVQTTDTRVVVRFQASRPDSLGPGATASEHHVFVLRAVDDRGGVSPCLVRAFYASTVAPDVQITRPRPNRFLPARVPIPFSAEWTGHDPDGEGTGRPAFHRWRLLLQDDPANWSFSSDPDSLLRLGAATGWSDWHVVGGDTSSVMLTHAEVLPAQAALLAVVAVDEAGATTPYLLHDRNFLLFQGGYPNSDGPRIHIFSPLVDFTYESGGWSVDPLREVPVQAGSQQSLEFHWDGIPAVGRALADSRWKLDGDPLDDAVRSDPADLARWSERGPGAGSAQLPPLAPGTHRFYVEVRDDFGDRSLGIVRLEVIPPEFERELLVVDDTRREPDKYANDPTRRTPDPYVRPWPSATELDTFLFARGGVPWRGTKNPPEGVLSTPGLFAGYPFDTLGTRRGFENAADAVPLSTLAGYRHVVWIIDGQSALNTLTVDQSVFPVTSLRAMSRPGIANTLGAYVAMGGRVWLLGGGSAFASLAEFDRSANNQGQHTIFTVRDGELGPGRVMHDFAHVRSALGAGSTPGIPQRAEAARGGWTGHGPDGSLAAPDYARLPATLRLRTPAEDPLPPTRLASQGDLFYRRDLLGDFVHEPNEIHEDFDPDPSSTRFESALDTLFDISSPLPPAERAPCMLYYHGREHAPFVQSGFEIWNWTRSDCQALVDFVLGDIWRLTKTGPGAGAALHSTAGGAGPRVRTATPQRRATPSGGSRR